MRTRVLCLAALCCTAAQAQIGFCGFKTDGKFCDENYLKECKSREEVSSRLCREGCSSTGIGRAACGDRDSSTYCFAKGDGTYCDDQTVRTCKDSRETDSTYCPTGCKSAGVRRAACGSTVVSCRAVSDGTRCMDNYVVTCLDNEIKSQTYCYGETCSDNWAKRTAVCGSVDFCRAKLDGSYCDGTYAVTCRSGEESYRDYCGSSGCSGSMMKAECGTGRFCASQMDGSYCDGIVLKQCSNRVAVATVACNAGRCSEYGMRSAECRGAVSGSGAPVSGAAEYCTSSQATASVSTTCVNGMIVTCSSGGVQSTTLCAAGCKDGASECCAPDDGGSCTRYSYNAGSASAPGLALLVGVAATLAAFAS